MPLLQSVALPFLHTRSQVDLPREVSDRLCVQVPVVICDLGMLKKRFSVGGMHLPHRHSAWLLGPSPSATPWFEGCQ